jgi:antirestriction protein ArdC
MKRDLYADVSARIVAELERGAAPWIKPWSATPGANTPCNAVSNRPYSGCNVVLLWMAQAAGYRTPRFLTFKQALELGGNVRKGEHGTKVYFVKQLQVQDKGADDGSSTRLIPMMREYTVFNVDQCENLPDSIYTGKPMRVRNPDARDELADAFLHSTGADIREGHGEASPPVPREWRNIFRSICRFLARYRSRLRMNLVRMHGAFMRVLVLVPPCKLTFRMPTPRSRLPVFQER